MTTTHDLTGPLADLLPKWQRERRERGAPPIEPCDGDALAEIHRADNEDQPITWRRGSA